MPERPEIVCISGSARFMTGMRAANRELTLTGVIVVAPCEADESPTPEQRAVLGALHLRKIDLADRVLIVNPGGYVGESTRREIAYAQRPASRSPSPIPSDASGGLIGRSGLPSGIRGGRGPDLRSPP